MTNEWKINSPKPSFSPIAFNREELKTPTSFGEHSFQFDTVIPQEQINQNFQCNEVVQERKPLAVQDFCCSNSIPIKSYSPPWYECYPNDWYIKPLRKSLARRLMEKVIKKINRD